MNTNGQSVKLNSIVLKNTTVLIKVKEEINMCVMDIHIKCI